MKAAAHNRGIDPRSPVSCSCILTLYPDESGGSSRISRKAYIPKTPSTVLKMQSITQVSWFLAFVILFIAILTAGCTAPTDSTASGTLVVTSDPEGGEVYLDNEFHGSTPVTIRTVPVGNHQVEIRKDGYEHWSGPVTVTGGGMSAVPANLIRVVTTLPVTFATTTTAPGNDLPRIHVDGYWTWPGTRGTTNPFPLLIHVNGDNVGDADAREVTVAANLYYEGRMVCWNTIYLGTLKAGGHVTKDTMVSCTLPSGLNDQDLLITFENVVITG